MSDVLDSMGLEKNKPALGHLKLDFLLKSVKRGRLNASVSAKEYNITAFEDSESILQMLEDFLMA